MKRRAIGVLGVVLGSLVVGGCGYHVAGHGPDALPKTIHVIAVPAMENDTKTFKIEQRLTAATIHEFLARTKYKVVSDPNDADAVLTGKVLTLEILPLLFQTPTATTQTEQATAMIVNMKCEVTLTERDNEKVLYHTDNFVFRNEYQLATSGQNATSPTTRGNVEEIFQESDPAFQRMAQDFAARLVAAVTENY
ncbi:MAG TPA: LPS assembly lipoprotein LptE [Verrucomicrobiae bacterium]|nr:LPS assembly lipoprotein LptE [Verrucomicrobiae bacterium]